MSFNDDLAPLLSKKSTLTDFLAMLLESHPVDEPLLCFCVLSGLYFASQPSHLHAGPV
jgi:hypothetical protein